MAVIGRRQLIRVRRLVMMVVHVVMGFTVVMGRFNFLDYCVETVFVVGGVFDHPSGTVRFYQTVRTLDVTVPVARLVLALDVVRVKVLHAVIKMIRSRRMVVAVLDDGMIVVLGFVTVILFWIRKHQTSR